MILGGHNTRRGASKKRKKKGGGGEAFLAKSVIIECADPWAINNYLGIRSVEFTIDAVVQTMNQTLGSFYSTSQLSADYDDWMTFDTSKLKTGSWWHNQWVSGVGFGTNQRLIAVFNTPIAFDGIIINNNHTSGAATNRGVKNVKIYKTKELYTDTTYGAGIDGGVKIYDGIFDEHVPLNVADDQILNLI